MEIPNQFSYISAGLHAMSTLPRSKVTVRMALSNPARRRRAKTVLACSVVVPRRGMHNRQSERRNKRGDVDARLSRAEHLRWLAVATNLLLSSGYVRRR